MGRWLNVKDVRLSGPALELPSGSTHANTVLTVAMCIDFTTVLVRTLGFPSGEAKEDHEQFQPNSTAMMTFGQATSSSTLFIEVYLHSRTSFSRVIGKSRLSLSGVDPSHGWASVETELFLCDYNGNWVQQPVSLTFRMQVSSEEPLSHFWVGGNGANQPIQQLQPQSFQAEGSAPVNADSRHFPTAIPILLGQITLCINQLANLVLPSASVSSSDGSANVVGGHQVSIECFLVGNESTAHKTSFTPGDSIIDLNEGFVLPVFRSQKPILRIRVTEFDVGNPNQTVTTVGVTDLPLSDVGNSGAPLVLPLAPTSDPEVKSHGSGGQRGSVTTAIQYVEAGKPGGDHKKPLEFDDRFVLSEADGQPAGVGSVENRREGNSPSRPQTNPATPAASESTENAGVAAADPDLWRQELIHGRVRSPTSTTTAQLLAVGPPPTSAPSKPAVKKKGTPTPLVPAAPADDAITSILEETISDYEKAVEAQAAAEREAQAEAAKQSPSRLRTLASAKEALEEKEREDEANKEKPKKKVWGASERLLKPVNRPQPKPMPPGPTIPANKAEELVQRLFEASVQKARQWSEKVKAEQDKHDAERYRKHKLTEERQHKLIEELHTQAFAQMRSKADQLIKKYVPEVKQPRMTMEQEKETIHHLYEEPRELAKKRNEQMARRYLSQPNTVPVVPKDTITTITTRLYQAPKPRENQE